MINEQVITWLNLFEMKSWVHFNTSKMPFGGKLNNLRHVRVSLLSILINHFSF